MRSCPASRDIHWQAPTIIILAFAVSLAVAIGHHVFYTSLDQSPVDDNAFSQQTNIAIGTGFAFLFRACLAIATCTAYWQVFWHTALRKTITISSADALTGVLGSLMEFTNVRAFFCNPGLAALALLAWLVPLASLLPPATLSVLPSTIAETVYERVPVPVFDTPGMVSTSLTDMPSGILDLYGQPYLHLSRMLTTTAYRGTVAEHQTVHKNATYEIAFNAPAIQCLPISQDILEPFNLAAGCDILGLPVDYSKPANDSCDNQVPYIAWVPKDLLLVPFDNHTYTLDKLFLPLDVPHDSGPYGIDLTSNYIGGTRNGPATLLVATRSHAAPYTDWNVLNCSLSNATYVVNMSSDSNGRSLPYITRLQKVDDEQRWRSSQVPRDGDKDISAHTLSAFNYLGMMECLNRLLVGTIAGSGPLGNTGYWVQAMLRAQNPHLMSTLLAFTQELSPLLANLNVSDIMAAPDPTQWTPVNGFVDELGNHTISLPTEAVSSPSFNQSLGSAIEELFQNMTLSLFSDSRFTRDSRDPVNITLSHFRNIYSYSQRNLLLSYSIALFLTLLASIAGCIAIYWNGASYTQKFSTILRTTSSLGQVVAENDRAGADPLPRYLARARVKLGGTGDVSLELDRVSEAAGERSAMIDPERDLRKEPVIVHQRSLSED